MDLVIDRFRAMHPRHLQLQKYLICGIITYVFLLLT